MAIYSMSVSDDTINALLQSPDPSMVALGQQYKDEKAQQDKELGRDEGIMGAISNIFGFGSAQGAEPGTGQRYNNQFSVTQPSQFDFKGAQLFDPTNMMRGSVVENVVDTPTREFGTIRAGQPELGIFGAPQVQDMPVDLEELAALEDDVIEQQLAAASRGEGETFFDRLKDIGGNVLDYIKGGGIIGKGITSLANFRDAIGTRLGPASYGTSQAAFNAMTPSQQRAVGNIYGPGGIMQGYNVVSAFGRGPAGAIQNRIDNILGRKAAGKSFSAKNLAELQAAAGQVGGGDDSGSGSSYDSATGGTFGSSVDDASSFSDYT